MSYDIDIPINNAVEECSRLTTHNLLERKLLKKTHLG